jgi:serine/threonine protein kinase
MPATDRIRAALADRYHIEREIGAGGMATVYLARDLKHDREVALKVLRSDLSAVIGTERFLSEVRISARLDHPHILTLIDSGQADGILYYVLPYVRGESLRAKLERERQLSVDEALSITKQVASALDYAHAQGVVHRDIKPENILLHEGVAVLADFGIALAVKEAGGNRLTETGLSLGTPQYMSPEQATGDRALDKRSDIYSLGAVFYEMIAGEPPVTGATAQAMIAKLLTEKPVKLRVVRDTLPASMERATEKALSKVPADRFASAGDFVRALSAAEALEKQPGHRSLRRIGIIGAATAIVLVAVVALLKTSGRNGPLASKISLTDRRQITNTGRAHSPTISADGKLIAYVVIDCSETRCTTGIDLRDVASGVPKRVLEGLSSVNVLSISPDRRHLMFHGSYRGTFGSFIVPTLGGEPRFLGGRAEFFAGGDSIILIRNPGTQKRYWVSITGVDGAAADSFAVDHAGDGFPAILPAPGSGHIFYAIVRGAQMRWGTIDRSGKFLSHFEVPRGSVRQGAVTNEALWLRAIDGERSLLVRVPYDARTGQLSNQRDTVFTGRFSAFGITADGKTVVVDEPSTEWEGFWVSGRSFLAGSTAPMRRQMRSTQWLSFTTSPDGRAVTLAEQEAGSGRKGLPWSIIFNDATPPIPIPGRHLFASLSDSTTVEVIDAIPGGVAFSLWNYRTKQRSAAMSVNDSTIRYIVRLPGVGWGWIAVSGKAIYVRKDSDAKATEYRAPSWYRFITSMSPSRDGKAIAFTGWNDPTEDSLGVGVLTLSDGKFARVHTAFAEGGSVQSLGDGSLLFKLLTAPDKWLYSRILPDGRVERLGAPARLHATAEFSSDLSQVFVSTGSRRGDIWMLKASGN